MRNEIKNILQVALVAVLIVAVFAWSNVNNSMTIGAMAWAFRIVSPIVALALTFVLMKNRLRKEPLPDYLRNFVRHPFECNGLCFGLVTEAVDGCGELHVLFQNRFANPCSAVLVLTRNHGFASSQKLLEYSPIHVECAGGAFGLMRVPLPVPRKYQGKRKSFTIKGQVSYPHGRGELLRFRSGRDVGADAVATSVLRFAVSMCGVPAANRPAYFKMRYPKGVAETLPPGQSPTSELLWQPGDEVIELELRAAA